MNKQDMDVPLSKPMSVLTHNANNHLVNYLLDSWGRYIVVRHQPMKLSEVSVKDIWVSPKGYNGLDKILYRKDITRRLFSDPNVIYWCTSRYKTYLS